LTSFKKSAPGPYRFIAPLFHPGQLSASHAGVLLSKRRR
jgi:hypothetical protein